MNLQIVESSVGNVRHMATGWKVGRRNDYRGNLLLLATAPSVGDEMAIGWVTEHAQAV